MADANPLKLDADQIAMIMSSGRSRGPKSDPTEPREHNTWFKLNQLIREERCDNPDCLDPRDPETDRGAFIVAHVKGKYMCRRCFLAGWLSTSSTGVI